MAASGWTVSKPQSETKQGREQQKAPLQGSTIGNCRKNPLSTAGCGKILANGPWEDKRFLVNLYQGGRIRWDWSGRKPIRTATPTVNQP